MDELTGTWISNDNGTYYIRQNGDIIWWFGRDTKRDREDEAYYSNVFKGRKTADIIEGQWSDVPFGNTMSFGELKIEIKRDNNDNVILSRISHTGGFGGSVWEKV